VFILYDKSIRHPTCVEKSVWVEVEAAKIIKNPMFLAFNWCGWGVYTCLRGVKIPRANIYTALIFDCLRVLKAPQHTWAASKIWLGHLSEKCRRQVLPHASARKYVKLGEWVKTAKNQKTGVYHTWTISNLIGSKRPEKVLGISKNAVFRLQAPIWLGVFHILGVV